MNGNSLVQEPEAHIFATTPLSSPPAPPGSRNSHERKLSGGSIKPNGAKTPNYTGSPILKGSSILSSSPHQRQHCASNGSHRQPVISEEDSRRGSGSSSDNSSSFVERQHTSSGGPFSSTLKKKPSNLQLQPTFSWNPYDEQGRRTSPTGDHDRHSSTAAIAESEKATANANATLGADGAAAGAPIKLFGIELKWISLVTLALQNAFLTIIMHYSRITTTPSETYSAASAVLMNELLKGTISVLIALKRVDIEMSKAESHVLSPMYQRVSLQSHTQNNLARDRSSPEYDLDFFIEHAKAYLKPDRWRRLASDIFSQDCWKLSIPAVLYVIQNNLQYVAASNLDVATFQVTYQMKILTTAFFSVLLLGKKLSRAKWLALLLLAAGVGIVQIQSGNAAHSPIRSEVVADVISEGAHHVNALRSSTTTNNQVEAFQHMSPLRGFSAVSAACVTSGLAGVYFEMVLKGSKADLWTRNIQLSVFSLVPAVLPIIFGGSSSGSHGLLGTLLDPFKNFGLLAWGTVLTQVFGGLITALVIKYSDNILKGFATSLSIIISFLASVGLFAYPITPAFVMGSSVVLAATWMYNQPPSTSRLLAASINSSFAQATGRPEMGTKSRIGVAVPGSPISSNAPIIGETPRPSRTNSVVSLLGLGNPNGGSRAPTPINQMLANERASPPVPSKGFYIAPSVPFIPESQTQTQAQTHNTTPLSSTRNSSGGSLYESAHSFSNGRDSSITPLSSISSGNGLTAGPPRTSSSSLYAHASSPVLPLSADRNRSTESIRKHYLSNPARPAVLGVEPTRAIPGTS